MIDLISKDLRKIRVFVTDGYWRKTVAAVRALGRMGLRVTVGESTYLAPALFSRYCSRRVRTPSPVLEASQYLDFLENYLTHHPHQVLIPMEEDTGADLTGDRPAAIAVSHLNARGLFPRT